MVVNYPSKDVPFTRIVEYKHVPNQPEAVRQGKVKGTLIAKETSSSEGDPYYPVPNPKNNELYERYRALAEKEEGVCFVGRLASYKYFNMDQAILNALEIFDNLKETGKLQPKRRPEDFGPGARPPRYGVGAAGVSHGAPARWHARALLHPPRPLTPFRRTPRRRTPRRRTPRRLTARRRGSAADGGRCLGSRVAQAMAPSELPRTPRPEAEVGSGCGARARRRRVPSMMPNVPEGSLAPLPSHRHPTKLARALVTCVPCEVRSNP